MRLFRTLVLAGTAAAGVAGAALAAAATQPVHVQDVTLPNGMIAHIRYTGAVAPKLVLTPVAAVPVAPIALFEPFAEMDHVFAQMDAQADAMMRQAAALAAQAPAMSMTPNLVSAGKLPADSVVHYSFVSTSNGGATCSRSVQVTSAGNGATPQVVSHQAGDCSKMGLVAPTPVAAPAVSAAPRAPLPVSAPKPATPPVPPADTI